MPQRSRKRAHARIAAVLAAPAVALTLMAPCASAATPADAPVKCKEATAHMSRMAAPCHSTGAKKDTKDTPTKCEGTTHVSLLGHEACLTRSDDEDSSSDGLLGLGSLLGIVTGLVGGLLGGGGGG